MHPGLEQVELSHVLHALSDPTRLAIVCALAHGSERTCGQFDLGLSKATWTHHFRVLREAGLTRTRIEGKHRYISLRRDEIDQRFPDLLASVLRNAHPPVPDLIRS